MRTLRGCWRQAAAWLVLAMLFFPLAAFAGDVPKEGEVLPPFTLTTPVEAADRAALGLGDAPAFALKDIKAEVILLEVIGIYCPQCHRQAPLFNSLYARLEKDEGLAGKVKMLAMATGATPQEIDYARSQGFYAFPVAGDPDFVAHKLLGEPKTPFTLLVDKNGKVLFAHLGVIEDMAGFYQQIAKLAR